MIRSKMISILIMKIFEALMLQFPTSRPSNIVPGTVSRALTQSNSFTCNYQVNSGFYPQPVITGLIIISSVAKLFAHNLLSFCYFSVKVFVNTVKM